MAPKKDLVPHLGVLNMWNILPCQRRKGSLEEQEEGYVDGKNIKIDYQNAQRGSV